MRQLGYNPTGFHPAGGSQRGSAEMRKWGDRKDGTGPVRSFVPDGTHFVFVLQPSDKSLGYFRASLRDAESRHAKDVQAGALQTQIPALSTPRSCLSLLGANVQPDHGSSGFADNRIAIATPATFEPGFGREIAGQETEQDPKNNQACDRKQHRIANIHGWTVVSSHGLVKRARPAALFFPNARSKIGAGTASSPRFVIGGLFAGMSRPRPLSLANLTSRTSLETHAPTERLCIGQRRLLWIRF